MRRRYRRLRRATKWVMGVVGMLTVGYAGSVLAAYSGGTVVYWWRNTVIPHLPLIAQAPPSAHALPGVVHTPRPSATPAPPRRASPAPTPAPATPPPAVPTPAPTPPPAWLVSVHWTDALGSGRVAGDVTSGQPLSITLHAGEVLEGGSGRYSVGLQRGGTSECPAAPGRNCVFLWGATHDETVVISDYVAGHLGLGVATADVIPAYENQCAAALKGPDCAVLDGATSAVILVVRDGTWVQDPVVGCNPAEWSWRGTPT